MSNMAAFLNAFLNILDECQLELIFSVLHDDIPYVSVYKFTDFYFHILHGDSPVITLLSADAYSAYVKHLHPMPTSGIHNRKTMIAGIETPLVELSPSERRALMRAVPSRSVCPAGSDNLKPVS